MLQAKILSDILYVHVNNDILLNAKLKMSSTPRPSKSPTTL